MTKIDDFDDYGFGAEMTSKNCLISFNLSTEGISGLTKDVVSISVDHYDVAADGCGWGGLHVCVQLGSGKVPSMLLRLGFDEESGVETEASTRCFRDVLQKLGLGSTSPDQFLLALLATALPLNELKWIGNDTGYYDQDVGDYAGEDWDGFICSMQVLTHAMRLLAKGGKKSACKVGEIINLLHSDDEQGGHGGGNGDGEVRIHLEYSA